MSKKRSGVNESVRKVVMRRDDGMCVRCKRRTDLQVHHIVPVYKGGTDIEDNLITLCRWCHEVAPDDPVELFKWCAEHLPPSFGISMRFTKVIILCLKKSHRGLLLRNGREADEELMGLIEGFFVDLWRAFLSNKIEDLSDAVRKLVESKNPAKTDPASSTHR